MNWDNQIIDFGDVKPREQRKATATYTGTKAIVSAAGSCGCIAHISIEGTKKVHFMWTADELPYDKKEMFVQKLITVTYMDGSMDFIEIKAVIKK